MRISDWSSDVCSSDLDFAYAPAGAFGLGGAYAEHDISARGTPEAVDGRTWTVGAYVTQGFGPLYANAKLAYGWTNYEATRTMGLLARTADASINAKQLDASIELGYDYRTGSVTIKIGRASCRERVSQYV